MTKSAVAYWANKYNAEVALLTTQQAATTAEHNARYVNNLGTGPLWSAQDATDVAAAAAAATTAAAALTAETNLYNTAEAARVTAVALAASYLASWNAEIAARVAITPHTFWEWNGTLSGSPANGSMANMSLSNPGATGNGNPVYGDGTSLYAQKTGYYVFTCWFDCDTQGNNAGTVETRLMVNGANVFDKATTLSSHDVSGHYCYWSGLLSAGQTFLVQAMSTSGAAKTIVASGVKVTFVPTPANPF